MDAPLALRQPNIPASDRLRLHRYGDEFSVQLHNRERRITAHGELDGACVRVLVDVMNILVEVNPGDSTIDLRDVTFIDAAVLGCLVGFGNQLEAVGARLSVIGATPRVRRVFGLVDLDRLLDAA
jgi:anti-anti-sigma factor